jgi:hypothetical protein
MVCFIATNLAPKTEVSIVPCFLETQLINQSHVTEDQEVSARVSGFFVPCLVSVGVAHHANIEIEVFAQRLRHVMRNSLHYITVELNAVIMRKGIHVDGGVGPVNN